MSPGVQLHAFISSQPLAASPSQSKKPGSQAPTVQSPIWQLAAWLGGVMQGWSHMPQCNMSTETSTQPPPQQVRPESQSVLTLQPSTHSPFMQISPAGQVMSAQGSSMPPPAEVAVEFSPPPPTVTVEPDSTSTLGSSAHEAAHTTAPSASAPTTPLDRNIRMTTSRLHL